MNPSSDSIKLGPINAPRNPMRLIAWLVGNFFFALLWYWTIDSFFAGSELSAQAMLTKVVVAGISFVAGLWLMHINHS